MNRIELRNSEIHSVLDIQRAIDSLGQPGGTVVLPEIELDIDRGLELRSKANIIGCGNKTVLRSVPGRIYPLDGFQVYGMYDVSVLDAHGLIPGMDVAIRDDRYGDFFETSARITWVAGTRVGLDHPLVSDYGEPGSNPRMITSFPLIFGAGVKGAAVRTLTLDGNRNGQPEGIGACRGAALYFIHSAECTIEDIRGLCFPGEGLGFQMCRQMHVHDCVFSNNSGNGYHPGAGSTAAVFRRCRAEDNGRCGLFFCARATRTTVEDCEFRRNQEAGLSLGVLDCHNRIVGCLISNNRGPGVLVRPERKPTEVHSCEISDCSIEHNIGEDVIGQIDIRGEAHELIIEGNRISGDPTAQTAGISVGADCRNIYLERNRFEGCTPEVDANHETLRRERPRISAGVESVRPEHFRHLSAGI